VFDRRRRGGAVNRDLLGFHRLGHFADQLDHEQPIGQIGAVNTDEVGQLEAALEAAIGDAKV
jgi:hypothetical protein